MSRPIPSCRLEHIRPYAKFLHDMGVPVNHTLTRHRLPTLQTEIPGTYLPLSLVSHFLEYAAKSQGIDEFGLRAVGTLRIDNLGEYFVTRARNSPTLLVALTHFQRLAPLEDTNTFVWMTSREKDLKLSMNSCFPFNQFVLALHDRHLLITLIAIVRGFAGPKWVPTEIGFRSTCPVDTYAAECFPDTRFHYGQGETWISIPHELLSLPPSFDISGMVPTEQDIRSPSRPLDLTESIKRIIAGYLRDSYPSMYFIASVAQLSPRTLQRRLKKLGTSYSELVLQTRYETATRMLREPGCRITDIAYELGYKDPAHFSRAFRRIAGLSPRAFSRQIQH